MARKKSEIRREVKQRGETVLRSDIFRKIMKQKHHNGTVGAHSIGVAEDSVKIADALEKIGLHADRDVLVWASLCHDFGMLNRSERYKSNVESWIKHPSEGLKNTREHFPSISEKEEDCIRHHMWPFTLIPPHTLEGAIVCLADKKSALREVVRNLGKTIDPDYLKDPEVGPEEWKDPEVDPEEWKKPQTGPEDWKGPETGPGDWKKPETGPE